MTELDKYEYNLKLEEIDKLVDQGDYEEAAKLADTIDWRRVRNVRTLCLISEIYEAADRLDKSKEILERAYRKSPVGRTVLYRLVEVTTELGEYDEALEYYTEYVQVAPHDNNRYILKYLIYKGRGSSPEELIAILEEYLGQEYTERWAYELALNYQQAGQMQKCIAACDDLVLWFHSGEYVKKALELKQHYAELTPKQQEIYESCLQEEEQEEQLDAEETAQTAATVPGADDMDGEVIAENIIAETEKEIADVIAAKQAEKEAPEETGNITVPEAEKEEQTPPVSEPAPSIDEEKPAVNEEVKSSSVPEDEDLQVALAKSVRKVISGVARKPEMNEEDVPAAVEDRLNNIQDTPVREEPEVKAGQLSIDDILLAMGEDGKKAMESSGIKSDGTEKEETPQGNNSAEDTGEKETEEIKEEPAEKDGEESSAKAYSIAEMMTDDLSQEELEALRYSDNPEKFLKNRTSLPTYASENSDEEGKEDVSDTMDTKTIRIPTEEVAHAYGEENENIDASPVEEELEEEVTEAEAEEEAAEAEAEEETAEPEAEEETAEPEAEEETPEPEAEEETAEPEAGEETAEAEAGEETAEAEAGEETAEAEAEEETAEPEAEEVTAETEVSEETAEPKAEEETAEAEEEKSQEGSGTAEGDREEEGESDLLTIEPYLRGLFPGFTEVEGLENQIANAILQVLSKGDDKTSRNGNILIFGAHGSGKTTLAIGIAKAVAQEKNNKVAKMARIYASDLNRRDIPATIAKIAGGTLIIEEAGDLDDKTVDQLTTVMEFRTDGLVIILEDEERYVHELLMKHPRFTMKFTAQIYLPEYTLEELLIFGQIHANDQDFRITDEAVEVIAQKVSDAAQTDEPITVAGMVEMVDEAIHHSNQILRRLPLGKKRYDENNYVQLFAKDFK